MTSWHPQLQGTFYGRARMFLKWYDLLRQSCYWISSFYVSDLAQEVPVPRHQSIRLHGLRILRLRAAPRTTMHVLFDLFACHSFFAGGKFTMRTNRTGQKLQKLRFQWFHDHVFTLCFLCCFHPRPPLHSDISACFLHLASTNWGIEPPRCGGAIEWCSQRQNEAAGIAFSAEDCRRDFIWSITNFMFLCMKLLEVFSCTTKNI